MKIAYYAPLKSPRHPRPSGDRLVARLFEQALAAGGFDVQLASEIRAWDGGGDQGEQKRIRDVALADARRLADGYAASALPPALWFTYHVYHKAPDWIGPLVSRRLGIPYVIAEASFAPKQDGGRWRLGHRQCRQAIAMADAVISLNRNDDPCLRGLLKPSCELLQLRPFISLNEIDAVAAKRAAVARRWQLPLDRPWLVAVAMMREGDKLSSYRELARALEAADQELWQLVLVGDGPARSSVMDQFRHFAARTTCTGLLDRESIFALLKCADIYVWPAVNEAYGMALLEAQACGLAVVASATGGVPQIVEHGITGLLAPPGNPGALGDNIRRLLQDPAARRCMGGAARETCESRNGIQSAANTMAGLIERLTIAGARGSP